MTTVEGKMNYVLEIDPTGEKHGLKYDNNMENDIACLMVAAQVLNIHLNAQHEFKKQVKAPSDKKNIAKNISILANALRGVKPVMHSLLNSYDSYKEHLAKQSVSNLKGNEADVISSQD